MVFFHGYLSSKEAFLAQISYFSNFFRVTVFDFLGFGKSPSLDSPFSVSDYANWTKEVLEKLGVKNPCVIAHSFGCRVAVKMASQGEEFEKIIMTGPAGIRLRKGIGYHLKVKTYRFVKKIAPRFAEKRFGSKEYRMLSPIMKESYKKIVNEDLRFAASKIKIPTLIIEGNEDKTTPLKEAEIYQKNIENCILKVIRGGHFAFVENPVTFNLLVEEFLYG